MIEWAAGTWETAQKGLHENDMEVVEVVDEDTGKMVRSKAL